MESVLGKEQEKSIPKMVEAMTYEEAINAIKSNYPPSHYSMLREALDTAISELKKAEKYKWHDLRKNPEDLPEAENKVDVVCLRGNREIRTHGMYEDGKIYTEDSKWFWNEIDSFGTYCEETDDYIIPEGWWEYRHYNPDEVYNNAIDDEIIAWREIEPFEDVER